MARIRETYPCLRTGSFLVLEAEEDLFVYARFDRESSVLVAVNHSPSERREEIRADVAGFPEEGEAVRLMLTSGALPNPGRKTETIKNGRLILSLPAQSASVYGYCKVRD